jgi:hypothetical protein
MIIISNGRLELSVTPSAYKLIYEPAGWSISQAETDEDVREDFEGEITQGDDEDASESDSELSEIPLNEMTSEQIRKYAKQLGVDLTGVKKLSDARNKIRAAL